MKIERVAIYRLSVPLETPYRLSFGPVRAFDTALVELHGTGGEYGLGEATYLTGYTDETIAGGWALTQTLAKEYAGREQLDVSERLSAHFEVAPFTATAFNTALEMAAGQPLLAVGKTTRAPILGLLHATETAAIETESQRLFADGFTTLKVKVGFDAARDSALVKRVQQVIGGRGRIRLDANQGYTRADACRFVTTLDPEGIELFEQPCAAGDWDSACAVARVSPVPMMLDESIYGLDDIHRAADLNAARYIKVKLMKLGGLDRLAAAIDTIRDCGMEPVLGNGVACEIGCWMEACIAHGRINNAGEMNGFLKPVTPLLANPLKFARGAIVLEPDFCPALDREALNRCTLERFEFASVSPRPAECVTSDSIGRASIRRSNMATPIAGSAAQQRSNQAVQVHPLTAAVGAEIRSVDLAQVDDAQFAAIQSAWTRHSALLFRGQRLDHDALINFSRRFGELDPPPVNENGKKFVDGYPDIYVVSNIIGADGTPIGSLGAGEAVWHTDMSYLPEPPDASLLYAVEIPAAGGDTWLCGMIAACASLPPALRKAAAGRSIKHDGTYNSGGYLRAGLKDSSDPANSVGTPHPIICVHPPSGRHTLYLGRRRNAYIVGMPLDESEALLDELWGHAARPEHAFAHRWQVGDVLMWDNRTTMHRRDPFDAAARRLMYRTQIKGKAKPARAL